MVTIKDVAELANVSTATVSRCIHGTYDVSEETKKKVYDAIKALNYSPNLIASALKSNSNNVIGIIVTDIQNEFYSTIISVLEERIEEHGYKLIVTFVHNNAEVEKKYINTLISMRVKAILYTPLLNEAKYYNNIQNHDVYSFQIYINNNESIDSLIINDDYGTYISTKHFLEKGHRNILLIDYGNENFTNRKAGYLKAFNEYGMEPDSRNFVPLHLPPTDVSSRLNAAFSQDGVTGAIVVSDAIALKALAEMKKLNKRLYDDISLIIYDDVKWASLLDITTIGHDATKIAEVVSGTVLKRLEEGFNMKSEVSHHVINPFLIDRNSVRCLK